LKHQLFAVLVGLVLLLVKLFEEALSSRVSFWLIFFKEKSLIYRYKKKEKRLEPN
jgi:hypothetical protein